MTNDYLDSLNRYGGYEAPAIVIGSLIVGYSLFLDTPSQLFVSLTIVDRAIMSVLLGGMYVIPLSLMILLIPVAFNWKRKPRKIASIIIILGSFWLAYSNLTGDFQSNIIIEINQAWNSTLS